jgi:hypothetical protein
MPTAWGGADPNLTDNTDGPVEVGAIFIPLQAIDITGIRIWMHTSATSVTGRTARVWDYDTQTLLGSVAIDNAPWSGWKTFTLSSPITRSATSGTSDTTPWVVVSFTADGYGYSSGVIDLTSVDSPDGAVRVPSQLYLSASPRSPGGGRYIYSAGSFPTNFSTGTSVWYGVDMVYALTGTTSAKSDTDTGSGSETASTGQAENKNVWTSGGRSDPASADNTDGPVELGTVFAPLQDVDIVGVRIHMHTGAQSVTGRTASLWDYTTGTQLASTTIDTAPWSGWKEFYFSAPVAMTAASPDTDTTKWGLVSFTADGYSYTDEALATATQAYTDSEDGAVRIPGAYYIASSPSPGVPGNGRYVYAPGTFPVTGSNTKTFYGVDVIYQYQPDPPVDYADSDTASGVDVDSLNAGSSADYTDTDSGVGTDGGASPAAVIGETDTASASDGGLSSGSPNDKVDQDYGGGADSASATGPAAPEPPTIVDAAGTLPDLYVEIATGPADGVLTLDDSVDGRLGFTVLGDSLSFDWTDVTPWVRVQPGIRINRGGTVQRGPAFTAEAGSLSVTLNNLAGRFDPFNASAPYLRDDGSSMLEPGLPIRVRAVFENVNYTLFLGNVTSWLVDYPEKGVDSVATVSASDAIGRLSVASGPPLTTEVGDGETAGERIVRWLDHVGWYPTQRDVDTETLDSFHPTVLEGEAWPEIRSVAEDVNGYLFIDRDGRVVYRDRSSFQRVAGWSIGDVRASTDVAAATIQVSNNPDQLYNTVTVSSDDGYTITLTDSASVERYGARSYERTGLQTTQDFLVDRHADYVLSQHKDHRLRVEGFEVPMHAGSSRGAWLRMLAAELTDRITGQLYTPDDRLIERDALIRGLSLSIAPTVWTWQVSTFAAPEVLGNFTLDDPTYGVLDVSTLAAF